MALFIETSKTDADHVPTSAVTGIVWPALADPEFTPTLAILGQLLTTQWWSPETILRRQLQQLTQLVSFAAQTVPFYRLRLAEFARPRRSLTLAEWRRISLLHQRDIQKSGSSLVTARPLKEHGLVADIQRSDTMGEPFVVKRSAVAARFSTALTLRDHLAHRRDFLGKLACIRRLDGPAGKPRKPGSWVEGFPSGPLLQRDIGDPLDETLEWLAQEEPAYLMTVPSYLRALIERSAEIGAPHVGLRGVITFGEAVEQELRVACADCWQVSVTDTYRTAEVGPVAFQCPDHTHYLAQAEGVFVEVLDDAGAPCTPGDVGRVVVTPLHNFSMPLIRYDTGDFAEVGAPCESGRGLPVLKRIIGPSKVR